MKDQIKRWLFSILFLVVIIGPWTFERGYPLLEPDDENPKWVKVRWWGFQKRVYTLKWMKPSGYDYWAWCTHDSRGEWYPFLVGDDDTP